MDATEVLDAVSRHESRGRALLLRVSGALDPEAHAQGSWVVGASGRRYLDLGGFAVFLLGHRHPRVIEAVTSQLACMPCSSRALPQPRSAEAATRLARSSPPGLDKVMFLSSGAEVTEAALKLARVRTGREGFCHVEGSYHGKSFGALSVTDGEVYKKKCGSLLGPTWRLPRSDAGSAVDVIRKSRPAGVIVEAVQGEGGVHELSSDWLSAVAAACKDVGALLIGDEIQCGLGRTGDLWAISRAGVCPDILLSGKALGGGVLPVSALVSTADAFGPFDRDPYLHTSTMGGNPLACAAVSAVLQVIEDDDIPRRAREKGLVFRRTLDAFAGEARDLIREVRGRGLLLAIECVDPTVAGFLIAGCLKSGILVTPCTSRPAVIRMTPSAYIDHEELDYFQSAFDSALSLCRKELTRS